MNDDSYSVYEAKAHFSELLRKVQANKRVFITHRGKPIAAIVPLDRSDEGLEARLERLAEEGTVSRDAEPLDNLIPIVKRKGALARFLAERD
jgi:prevent-host-death family protein